ncbi:hypothetical protein GQ457_18G025890 [Hibiscus cannabinus]
METKRAFSSSDDHESKCMVSLLREVEAVTCSMFEYLLTLISGPKEQSEPGRWLLVAKLLHQKRIVCEQAGRRDINEFVKVDAALKSLLSKKMSKSDSIMNVEMQSQLKDLELCIGDLEDGLECLFRYDNGKTANSLHSFFCKTKKMAASPLNVQPSFHARSNSLPSRQHPITSQIDENVNRLRESRSASTSSSIGDKLNCLQDLYEYVDMFLQLPLTQQALAQEQQKKLVDELLDGSLVLLDVCGTAKDALLQTKECTQELQSILRRRKGIEGLANEVRKYFTSRKAARKAICKALKNLRHMENKFSTYSSCKDSETGAVISTLKQVEAVTISVLESLLSFISGPVADLKSSNWSLVSMLMHRNRVMCEGDEQKTTEIANAEAALRSMIKSGNMKHVDNVQKELQNSELCIQDLEEGPEAESKSIRWSLVSKLMRQKRVMCKEEEQKTNEITNAEAALLSMIKPGNMKNVENVQKELQNSEMCIQDLEEEEIMANVPSSIQTGYHTRSNSFPSRSHPLTLEVDEHLSRLASSESASTSSSLNRKLGRLQVLHECTEKLLQLPLIQQILSQEQQRENVDELLNVSLRLLDVCTIAKDALLQVKESTLELQSVLRRKKGAKEGFANEARKYLTSKNAAKKAILKALKSWKHKEITQTTASNETGSMVSLLSEVQAVTLGVLQSVLSFTFGAEKESQARRWSFVSKLLHTKRVGSEGERQINEMANAEASLLSLATSKSGMMQIEKVQNELKSSECCIQDFEQGLEDEQIEITQSPLPLNCGNINYLSNELRFLDWTWYPLRFLPSSFQLDNIVALLLSYNHIQQLWKERLGIKSLHLCLQAYFKMND